MFGYNPQEHVHYSLTSFDYISPRISDSLLQEIDEDVGQDHINIPLTESDVADITNLADRHKTDPTIQAGHQRDILWINNAVYHRPYPRVKIGSGGFGTTEYVQDINTAEWFVLKSMHCNTSTTDETERYIANECAIHSIIHQKKVNFFKIQNPTTTIFEFIMPLEQGSELKNAVKRLAKYRNNPEGPIFDLLINGAEAVLSFHEQRLLHRDIKSSNMIVDPTTRHVRLIDFGLAIKQSDKSSDIFAGTPGYQAPEIASSTKADIYALGKTYAYALGLAMRHGDELNLLTSSDPKFKHNSRIKDPRVKAMVLAYLTKMTNDDPNERPTAKEVKEYFAQLRDLYLDAHAITQRICFLQVNQFTTVNSLKGINLKRYDEVILIAEKNNAPQNTTLARIRKLLDEKGILIKNELVTYRSAEIKNQAILEFTNRREKIENSICKCYQASAEDAARKDCKVYKLSLTAEKEMARKILRHLQNNVARLEKKYSQHEADDRILIIKNFMENIRGQNISLKELSAGMKMLQATLLAHFFEKHHFKSFLKKHFHYAPTTKLLRDIQALIKTLDQSNTAAKSPGLKRS